MSLRGFLPYCTYPVVRKPRSVIPSFLFKDGPGCQRLMAITACGGDTVNASAMLPQALAENHMKGWSLGAHFEFARPHVSCKVSFISCLVREGTRSACRRRTMYTVLPSFGG